MIYYTNLFQGCMLVPQWTQPLLVCTIYLQQPMEMWPSVTQVIVINFNHRWKLLGGHKHLVLAVHHTRQVRTSANLYAFSVTQVQTRPKIFVWKTPILYSSTHANFICVYSSSSLSLHKAISISIFLYTVVEVIL